MRPRGGSPRNPGDVAVMGKWACLDQDLPIVRERWGWPSQESPIVGEKNVWPGQGAPWTWVANTQKIVKYH